MSLTKVAYTKDWTNPSDFPTIESSESQVRADMQDLYDQVKADVNAMIDELESSTAGSSGASQIGLEAISGVTGTDVQSGMESLKDAIDNFSLESLGVTATAAELNTLDGITASTAELNTLTGITATVAELNKLHGVATTSTELGYVSGVASSIQTQLDAKEKKSDADLLIANVTFTSGTGTFVFKNRNGGTVATIDTDIEKVPASMAIVDIGGIKYLRITNIDGSYTQCPVTDLFNPLAVNDTSTVGLTLNTATSGAQTLSANVKDGSITEAKIATAFKDRVSNLETNIQGYVNGKTDSSTVAITLSNGTNGKNISANIVSHSIGSDQIDSTYMDAINTAVSTAGASAINAAASESNANTYKGIAKSYAVGDESARPGSTTDNASYYSTQAAGEAVTSKSYAKGGTGSRSGEATDNAKYYKEQASASAVSADTSSTNATNAATNASGKALVSEGYAVGTQGGVDPGSGPYYHNNAKWYCEQAAQIVGGVYVTSVNGVTPPGGVSGGVTVDADHVSDAATTNKFTNAAEKAVWSAKQDALPSQTSQSGKFLTTDGSSMSWASVDALPSQTGQAGKFLTTNGSVASWANATIAIEFLDDGE